MGLFATLHIDRFCPQAFGYLAVPLNALESIPIPEISKLLIGIIIQYPALAISLAVIFTETYIIFIIFPCSH